MRGKLRATLAKGFLFVASLMITGEARLTNTTPAVTSTQPFSTKVSDSEYGHYGLTQSHHHYLNCSSNSVDSCPIWFTCNDTENGSCLCGPHKTGLLCSQQKLISAVLNCYCVTIVDNETYLGLCFYNCERPTRSSVYQNDYQEIPSSNLNNFMCGRFNRTGISCGECEPGLYPFVLSYDLGCVPCPDAHKNWWKFAVYGLAPLTVFYFFVVFFNINVTSSRLHGFLLFSQALSTPALVRILIIATRHKPHFTTFIKLLELFFSVWNLDPLRSVLPEICLNVNTLQSFALDICYAVYPLLLMVLSYLFIELHDRNYYFIVLIWKPFQWFFRLLREKWDVRTSVIDSFATFFLLSYVKILSVSVDLMYATPVYELFSNKTRYRVFYDSNMLFLQGEHLPYAVLSLLLLVFFILIPTLVLTLYPFQCFQKLLSCFGIQWHFLHTFVDSFQGCYKDGTEPGTRDLRWFSAYGLIFRVIVSFVLYVLTLSSMFFVYVVLATVPTIVLLINIQPYKISVSQYTTIDASFLILLSLFYVSLIGNNVATYNGKQFLSAFNDLAVVSCVIPIIYVVSIALHWIYSRRKWGRDVLRRMKMFMLDRYYSLHS